MNSKASQNLIAINSSGGHISGRVVTADEYAAEMYVTIPYDRIACIDLVMVTPSERRQGEGSKLVRKFMGQAKKVGATAVLAELVQFTGCVSVEIREAFFEKLGLTVLPINEDEHDTPPILMIAEL
jgi:GNAT superfamily N-acetyltransferase